RGVYPHAVIDLDALSESWPRPAGDPFNAEVTFRNLACVWANFRAMGAERLILPRVIESRDEVARYEEAVPGIALQICRLVAPEELRVARLTAREAALGSRAWHLARTVELALQMDRTRLEDYLVDNGDRPVEDVASDVLTGAGW